ncbi:ParA family protein [Vibrio parahaemolyticus]|nr:ParA family protein [Vibrio parahaemolyticus]
MGYKISFVSQKGGPGKSTIARAVGTSYAAAGWNVKIGDLDVNQSTSFEWLQRRLQNNIVPYVAVEVFGTAGQALRIADDYDLFIFDGAPMASAATSEISKASDLIVIPTGLAVDDLKPSVILAHTLVQKHGVDTRRIAFAFNRATGSESEYNEAQDYLRQTPYFLIEGRIEDKPSYRKALDAGRSILETPYQGPRKKADEVIQNIINRLEELTEE